MPQRALPDDDEAAVRALLPLPLVPARNRRVVRAECADRGRPRRSAAGRAGDRATRRRTAAAARKSRAVPTAAIALWSNYAGAGDAIRFVRVGTLDEPDRLPPDIHIFTSTKQPWVVLPAGTPAVAGVLRPERYWPAESLERRRALLAAKAPPRSATGSR